MALSSASTPVARIDWELLPSLRNLLSTRRQRSQPTWADTVVSDFDAPLMSGPFEERLPGLDVREVREPDIFAIFFS
jgi:hypothetical protein